MARLRNASSIQTTANKPVTKSRQALKEKTNTSRSKTTSRTDGSENPKAPQQTKQVRAHASMEHDVEDVIKVAEKRDRVRNGSGLVKKISSSVVTKVPVDNSRQSRQPTQKPLRRGKQTAQSDARGDVLESVQQRMEETAREQRASSVNERIPITTRVTQSPEVSIVQKAIEISSDLSSSTVDLDLSATPSPPRAQPMSVKGGRSSIAPPGSALRYQRTPAAESSILALKNFRRRPRQPSMLQMVQQRTASARPSPMIAAAVADENISDLDFDDDEDDFAPDAEGTPIRLSDAGVFATEPLSDSLKAKNEGPNRKRKSDEMLPDSILSSVSRKRRTRSRVAPKSDDSAIAVPIDESPEQICLDNSLIASSPQENIQVINSPTSSIPIGLELPDPSLAIPSTERDQRLPRSGVQNAAAPVQEEISSSVLADPVSSSPLPETASHLPPSQQHLADPLSQLSPEPPKRRARQKPVVPLSTAALQNLLPKRRRQVGPRQRKHYYELETSSELDVENVTLDASHLDDSEDELGGRLRRAAQSAKKTIGPSEPKLRGRKTTALATATKTTNAPSRASTRATGAKSTVVPPSTKKNGQRNYSRLNTMQDRDQSQYQVQDNDDDEAFEDADESTLPEISLSMQEAAQSAEIEAARKKFAEVDDWDMEFESMSNELHRSSSQGWR